jgi:DNA-binding transcriptional regulator YhcF (GntR family)
MRFTEHQAIYEQVADHVCEMILRGTVAEQERIPSVRELAMELQVNPNTVNKGYAYLQDQDIIHNQRGIGYFVADGGHERTVRLKRQEFINEELPRVFHTMDLLSIELSQLEELYDQYRRKQGDNR